MAIVTAGYSVSSAGSPRSPQCPIRVVQSHVRRSGPRHWSSYPSYADSAKKPERLTVRGTSSFRIQAGCLVCLVRRLPMAVPGLLPGDHKYGQLVRFAGIAQQAFSSVRERRRWAFAFCTRERRAGPTFVNRRCNKYGD
jgi:hypothetical protein